MQPSALQGDTFMQMSRPDSNHRQAELEALRTEVANLYDVPAATSFLGMAKVSHATGMTQPLHGLVGFDTDILDYGDLALFTGVHETVHARLGDSLAAEAVDTVAPHYRQHLHDVLIPGWLSGTVELRENEPYMQGRLYEGLVPGGWLGPQEVTAETTSGAMHNYFELVSRGLITKAPSGKLAHTSLLFRDWERSFMTSNPRPVEHYEDQPAFLAELVITGLSVGAELARYSRANSDLDLHTWEEGLANRIASDLTGVDLETAQVMAPQDEAKIVAARRLAEAGLRGDKLAETVHTYQDLERLVRDNF